MVKMTRQEVGRLGGLKKSPKKGFGSNKELARKAGQRGGRISKRTVRTTGKTVVSKTGKTS